MTRDAWEHFLGARIPDNKKPIEKVHKKTPQDLEFQIQSGFIDWVRIVEVTQIPELRALYAIPNGGHRHPSVGGKMKREGVQRGVPDLHLPIGRGGYFSLYLETKTPDGRLSQYQRDRIALLEAENNLVIVCRGVDELIGAVVKYLAMPPTKGRSQG